MDKNIILILVGSFTTLLGAIGNHFLGKNLARRNEYNQAVKEFISAFQEELTKLRLDCPAIPIYDIIYPARIKHGQAYAIFSRHLKRCRLKRFRRAWKEYYVLTPTYPSKDDDKDEEIILLVEKIENLLDFAKFK